MKKVLSFRIGPLRLPVKRLYVRVGLVPPARSVSSGVADRESLRLKYPPAP